MALLRMRIKNAIYPLLQEQFGRCAVALKQASRSTECVSSSMKYQRKAPSNRQNFAIYNNKTESNASVIFFTETAYKDAYAHVQ